MNLFTAILAALTGIIFYRAFLKMGLSLKISLTGALLFMLSNALIDQARATEVYVLNLLFFSINLWAAAEFRLKGGFKRGAFYFYTAGLGLSVHPYLFSISAITGFIWVLPGLYKNFKAFYKKYLILILFIIPGLMSYLYLPLSSMHTPPLMWGDMNTFKEVLDHLLRTKYGGLTVNNYSIKLFAHQFYEILRFLSGQLPLGLYLAGFVLLCIHSFNNIYKRAFKSPFFACALGAWAALLAPAVLINYDVTAKNIYITEPFYLTSLPMLAIFTAKAIELFTLWVSGYPGTAGFKKFTNQWGLTAIIAGFLYAWVFMSHPLTDHLEAPAAYVKNCLKSTSKNGSIFSGGDLLYLPWLKSKLIDKYRTDISVFQINGFIFQENPGLLKRLVNDAIKRGGAYITSPGDFEAGSGYIIKPWGFLYRIFHKNSLELENAAAQIPAWRWFDTGYLRSRGKDYLLRGIRRETREKFAEYLYSIDRPEDALKELQKSYEEAPEFEYSEYNFGCTLLNYKFYKEAEKQFKKACKRDPGHREAWLNLSIVQSRMDDYDNAVSNLRKYISINGGDALVYNNLAVFYSSKNLPDLAARAYLRALECDPEFKTSRMQLIRYYFEKNMFHEILKLTDQNIKTNSLDPEILYWHALALSRLYPNDPAMLTKALQTAGKSADLNISNPSPLVLMAQIFIRAGDNAKALEMYKIALSRGKRDPETLYNIAELARLSDPLLSKQYYEEVIKLSDERLGKKAEQRIREMNIEK
jgi:tetratricopeptide (TPR) repeat protein